MNIKFVNSASDPFYTELRKRVDEYFTKNNISKNANASMVVKTVILMTAYFTPYIMMLTMDLSGWAMFGLCVVMGVALAGVGMSVMHDSCHGSYSANRRVNKIMSYTMNLIGGNAFNWKVQHNIKHHTYTNIYGADEDVNNGDVIRLSPYSDYKWYHKYQHIYSWALYLLGTISWVTIKDFRQLGQFKREGMKTFSYSEEMTKLIITKLLYWGYMILIPIIFIDLPFYVVLLGFVLVHFVAGFILTVVFQCAHIVEDLEHDKYIDPTKINHSWAVHQILTTADFSRKNPILNWYLGGLNFQIEHHLFPNICHIHYTKISQIVKKTVQDFNMEYREFPNMMTAIASHYRTLKAVQFGARGVIALSLQTNTRQAWPLPGWRLAG